MLHFVGQRHRLAPLTFVSPPYLALMMVSGAKQVVEKAESPRLSDPIPTTVVPSRNCTTPVAVPGFTVAVNVTLWPAVDCDAGLAESLILELALFTVWTRTADELEP